ncbi:coagulation factor IXb [Polymixia lowei]
MARVCLLALIAGVLLETYGLGAGIPEENTDSVFVSQKSAATVLRRLRRYNSGLLEELRSKDNLERECMEEVCNMEEARETFEDDEKTMEFWVGYIDEDQCLSNPCQNGAVCKDGLNAYVCYCTPNFSGKNCEIEVAKQCSVNNGGCFHFCVMQSFRAVCQCAAGYKLASDKRGCVPTEHFPCGRVSMRPRSRSFITASSSSRTRNSNSNDTMLDEVEDYLNFNATLSYDYDLLSNDSDVSTSDASPTVESDLSNSSASAVVASMFMADSSGTESDVLADEPPTGAVEKKLSWAFPTTATIIAEEMTDKRIVGGNEATPGEIPWQVTLMTLARKESFCGGSLLSEVWVITAAHCLTQANTASAGFFIRVGEHDLDRSEGTERDHLVAEQLIHPHYDGGTSQYDHDIALLRLSSPVELSDRRRPICVGPKDFIENILRESSSSLVSGWGRLRFQGRGATKLQKLDVPYVDRTQCKHSSRDHITRFMFCAGYENEQMDSCQGDSGGPHATYFQGTWFLTGIVSWGEECAKEGKFGIYTRVSRYYKWISETTGLQINSQ